MYFIGITKGKEWCLTLLEGDELHLHYKLAVYGSTEDIVQCLEREIDGRPTWLFVDGPLVKGDSNGRKHVQDLVHMLYNQYGIEFSYDIKQANEFSFLHKITHQHNFNHKLPKKEFERTRIMLATNVDCAGIALSKFHEPVSDFLVHEGSLLSRYEALKELAKALHKLPFLELSQSMKVPKTTGLDKDEVEEFGAVLKTTLCAYIAFHAWMRPKECTLIGDFENGYVFLPVKPKQKTRFK